MREPRSCCRSLYRQAREIHRPAPAVIEPDCAVGDHARRRSDEAEKAERRYGFAGSGFTDHAERLAAPDLEADIVNRLQGAPADFEKRREVLDRQHKPFVHLWCSRRGRQAALGGGRRSGQRPGFQPRVQHIAHTVADQVDADGQQQNDQAGQEGHHRRPMDQVAPVAQHATQISGWRLGAEAEKREAGCFQDHPGQGRRHGDDHDRQHVGQDLGHDDARVGKPAQPRRSDIVLVLDRQRLPPHSAGEERDVDHGDCHQCIQEPWPQRRDDRQRQKEIGKGHQRVDRTHQHGVDPAAVECSHKTNRRTHKGGCQGGSQPDGDANPRAPDQPRQQITPQMVGAQPGARREERRQPVRQ